MDRMRATLCVFSLVMAFVLNDAAVSSAALPVPSGVAFYRYDAEATPLLTDDPASARPLAIGGLAEGGDTFTLHVGLNSWAGPVDIYFGAQILPLGPEIYLFLQDGSLKPFSQVGLLPWKVGTSANVSETLLGGAIPVSALPPGVYRLFLGVTPNGSMNAMHLWQADFQVGHWSEQQIEGKIMAAFGEDGGFSAIALAADQGYSVTQIVCAGMTDRLASNGAVTTYSGIAEAPEYAASNMLLVGPQVTAQKAGVKVYLSDILQEIKNTRKDISPGKSIFGLVLILLEQGYSAEQVFEGVILDNLAFETIPQMDFQGGEGYPNGTVTFPGDFSITDDQGRRVAPALPPSQILSNLKVFIEGDTSLRLVAGEANGSWLVSAYERGTNLCAIDRFLYIMNFGEGWVGPIQESGFYFEAKHQFTKPGIYQVYAKVGCQFLRIGGTDEQEFGVVFKRISNTLLVEVKPPVSDFPYALVYVTLSWANPSYLLALGAVREPISNLYVYPWEEPTVYSHYPIRPGSAHVAPSEPGAYILAVWVSGVPSEAQEPVDVPFTVTVETKPYTVSPDGISYGETISTSFSGSVTAIPAEPSDVINPFLLGGPVSVTTVVVNKPEIQ